MVDIEQSNGVISDKILWPTKVAPNPEVLTRRLHDELVLFHRKSEASCILDPVATEFWLLLVEESSVEQSFERLLKTCDVKESRLRQDFGEFLGSLLEAQWLQAEEE